MCRVVASPDWQQPAKSRRTGDSPEGALSAGAEHVAGDAEEPGQHTDGTESRSGTFARFPQ